MGLARGETSARDDLRDDRTKKKKKTTKKQAGPKQPEGR